MTGQPRTGVESYQQQLLLHLRLRDLPGPRIADVLAEVDAHTADTQEDPYEAFGPPKQYAAAVAASSGAKGGWRAWLSAQQVAIAVASGAGGYLLAGGVLGLGAGERGALGLPATLSVVLGLALWALVGLQLHRRRADDRVLDPRTGAAMTSASRWSAVMLLLPVVMLVLLYAGGVLRR